MVRIHIMGGGGSGKTTLGQEIAARFQVPLYELDQLGRKNGMQHELWLHDAFSIAKQAGWVTEGVGLIWIDPMLYHADYIVLMEVPWLIAAWRIIRRHFVKSLNGTNLYPGMKTLCKFLKAEREYYLNINRVVPAETIEMYLEEHGESTEPPDAEILLKRLEKYGLDIILPPTRDFERLYLKKYRQKVFVIRNNADRECLLELLAQQHFCQAAR